MLESFKEHQIQKILKRQEGNIKNIHDLTGDQEPSNLFFILANVLGYLLDNDVDSTISKNGVLIRRKLHFIIKMLGPKFLTNPQVFENREFLKNPEKYDYNPKNAPADKKIILPEEPVIWIANHGFVDDVLASVLAAPRQAYILFGSLPMFYNTFDGITAYLNGVAMSNRKVKASKQASIPKIVKAMEYGADGLIFSEGIWNKTPDRLLIEFLRGIYISAKETGAKVGPIIHYLRNHLDPSKDNVIHTVVDEPIRIDDLSQKAALDYLRDVMATWYYYMIEMYGKSTREELLNGYDNSYDAWTSYIKAKVDAVSFYDSEIECGDYAADYRPKDKLSEADIYSEIAKIENITPQNAAVVAYALTRKRQDYQRLY